MVNANAPSTVMVGLWVPVFFFGHAFAGFWLIRAALLTNPRFSAWVGRLLGRSTGGEHGAPTKARVEDQDSAVLADSVTSPRSRGEQWVGSAVGGPARRSARAHAAQRQLQQQLPFAQRALPRVPQQPGSGL